MLILASGSPRRAELLTAAGIPFEAARRRYRRDAADARSARGARPAARRTEGADRRADTTRRGRAGCGHDRGRRRSDSGQAERHAEAREMLRALSGRAHEVLTGVALMAPARTRRRGGPHRGLVRPAGSARNRLVRRHRRAHGQGRRLCDSGPGVAVCRANRGVVRNVVGPAGGACVPAAAGVS